MDRGVLLVLLCLQAFLLITAFTSTDAAALVKDDQQQQSIDQVQRGTSQQIAGKEGRKRKVRIGSRIGLVQRGTSQQIAGKEGRKRKVRIGSRIGLVKRFRLPKNPAEEVVLKKRGCADLPGGCGFLVKRFHLPKNPAEKVALKKRGCRWRQGGCTGLDQ